MNILVLASALLLGGEPPVPVHAQQYSMGTMFDILAYHEHKPDAKAALARAMAEIARLDRMMSHFKADSDLSQLTRGPKGRFVAVAPELYEVIARSLNFSRASDGAFDITVGPLVRVWKDGHAYGRRPSDAELEAARRCVGYDKIETRTPNLIRVRSECLELDLGAIGKGFAVDAAMKVLESAGIRHALINAGGSSIAAIGKPPGLAGWPVSLGDRRTLLLENASISTSQQKLTTLVFEPGEFGDVIDPSTAMPTSRMFAARVVAPSATVSDALSTILVMRSADSGARLLRQFPDVSAFWTTPAGEPLAEHNVSGLRVVQAGDSSHAGR